MLLYYMIIILFYIINYVNSFDPQLIISHYTNYSLNYYQNQPVIFDLSRTFDADGDVIYYQIDFGDGNIKEASLNNYEENFILHSYKLANEYLVKVSITDNINHNFNSTRDNNAIPFQYIPIHILSSSTCHFFAINNHNYTYTNYIDEYILDNNNYMTTIEFYICDYMNDGIKYCKDLTTEYERLGLQPNIKLKGNATVNNIVWNESKAVWIVNITYYESFRISITSNPVSLMGCLVDDRMFQANIPSSIVSNLFDSSLTPKNMNYHNIQPNYIRYSVDQCASLNSIAILNGNHSLLIISKDGFHYQTIIIDIRKQLCQSNIQCESNMKFIDVSLQRYGLLLLTNYGLFFGNSSTTFISVATNLNLNFSNLNFTSQIHRSTGCILSTLSSTSDHISVILRNNSNTIILNSMDLLHKNWNIVQFPNDTTLKSMFEERNLILTNINYVIHGLAINNALGFTAYLLNINNNRAMTLYHWHNDTWLGGFLFPETFQFLSTSSISSILISSSQTQLIVIGNSIWSSRGLQYFSKQTSLALNERDIAIDNIYIDEFKNRFLLQTNNGDIIYYHSGVKDHRYIENNCFSDLSSALRVYSHWVTLCFPSFYLQENVRLSTLRLDRNNSGLYTMKNNTSIIGGFFTTPTSPILKTISLPMKERIKDQYFTTKNIDFIYSLIVSKHASFWQFYVYSFCETTKNISNSLRPYDSISWSNMSIYIQQVDNNNNLNPSLRIDRSKNNDEILMNQRCHITLCPSLKYSLNIYLNDNLTVLIDNNNDNNKIFDVGEYVLLELIGPSNTIEGWLSNNIGMTISIDSSSILIVERYSSKLARGIIYSELRFEESNFIQTSKNITHAYLEGYVSEGNWELYDLRAFEDKAHIGLQTVQLEHIIDSSYHLIVSNGHFKFNQSNINDIFIMYNSQQINNKCSKFSTPSHMWGVIYQVVNESVATLISSNGNNLPTSQQLLNNQWHIFKPSVYMQWTEKNSLLSANRFWNLQDRVCSYNLFNVDDDELTYIDKENDILLNISLEWHSSQQIDASSNPRLQLSVQEYNALNITIKNMTTSQNSQQLTININNIAELSSNQVATLHASVTNPTLSCDIIDHTYHILTKCPPNKYITVSIDSAHTTKLPINYRPPSLLGVGVPTTEHFYNVNPTQPRQRNFFYESKESGKYKQCLNANNIQQCDCTVAMSLSQRIEYSDCIKNAAVVYFIDSISPIVQVYEDNIVSYAQDKEVLIVELNNRTDWCVGSSCGNVEHKFVPGSDQLKWEGHELYHFSITILDSTYCKLETQFIVFVTNPPLQSVIESVVIATTAMFIALLLVVAYLLYVHKHGIGNKQM